MEIGTQNINGQVSSALASRNAAQLGNMQSKMNSMSPDKIERIENTAQEFEAVFISQMMAHMFSGVETDPMFGGGKGEEVFRSMMVDEYGKQLSGSGGIGIADHVKAKLIEMQSQQTSAQEFVNTTNNTTNAQNAISKEGEHAN